jgi:hypothetical protein
LIDLFKASGVEAPEVRRKGVPRAQRVPLFNPKVVYREGGKVIRPNEEMQARATKYAKMAATESFAKQNETAIRNNFYEEVLCGLLGYRKFHISRRNLLSPPTEPTFTPTSLNAAWGF